MIADGQPGHIDQIKQINAGAVYRLIDRFGPISRIELSKRAQLAPASITKIVRELLEAHLVQETEFQEPGSRGRPAVGLTLDTASWHYLCVRIGLGTMTLALRDLSGALVAEEEIALPAQGELPLLTRIVTEIDLFFTRHQHQLERLTAIAITLPGLINAAQGIVHRMPYYAEVCDMALSVELSRHTGLPVYLQHDVCAWTMAESLFGAGAGCANLIQIVIDHNVGAGVISEGRLLNGSRQSLVEIGHTQVDPYGKQCYCGNHGCLETIAGLGNILTLAQQRLALSPSSQLHAVSPLNIEALCQAALQGDQLGRDLINSVGHSVGRIAAVMVNLFNPEKILIGSPLNQAAEVLFPSIASAIRQQALPHYTQHLSVEASHFHNHGTMPAAALVKEALYNGSLLVQLLQG
ncbi:sugar metabolism global transcriptional regulator Mlc [Edwardsiella anguillarum]|uniref:sugar metabolism global transcriptional regulator Mlc n=1 Tax=Edwardsiella anguillarum TaxID=1821960 RepID=UPI0024B681F7|nr:ROK family transcriptional regulator [Edwardsiella anguillarum]WHQ15777.1 ROK family protein [Edwardsiella anguillarum]